MPERKAALRRPSAQREAVRDHRRPLTRQLELFAGEALGSAIGAPTWSDLPRETRLALTQLMARLLIDHADRNAACCAMEVSHDC
jgi:hypothetical protein